MRYKFLAKGALGPFSGFTWPQIGDWVEVDGPLLVGRNGIHACRVEDLAHWLHEELWEIELDGEQLDALDCIVARRGRLVRHVTSWFAGGAQSFAEAAIEHALAVSQTAVDAQVQALITDAHNAANDGYFAVCAFAAATAVASAGGVVDRNAVFRGERAWQAEWIARNVIG